MMCRVGQVSLLNFLGTIAIFVFTYLQGYYRTRFFNIFGDSVVATVIFFIVLNGFVYALHREHHYDVSIPCNTV